MIWILTKLSYKFKTYLYTYVFDKIRARTSISHLQANFKKTCLIQVDKRTSTGDVEIPALDLYIEPHFRNTMMENLTNKMHA